MGLRPNTLSCIALLLLVHYSYLCLYKGSLLYYIWYIIQYTLSIFQHGIRATPWVLGRSPPNYGPRVWLVRHTWGGILKWESCPTLTKYSWVVQLISYGQSSSLKASFEIKLGPLDFNRDNEKEFFLIWRCGDGQCWAKRKWLDGRCTIEVVALIPWKNK